MLDPPWGDLQGDLRGDLQGDLRGDLRESSSQPSSLEQSAQLVRMFHHEKPLQIDSIGQNRGFIRL
jgi:hypothetical protein